MELKVEGRNLNVRDSWQEKIQEEQERLDRHHPGLVHNLRVSVEAKGQQKLGGYEVRLVAGVPNGTIVVKKKGETVRSLLIDAFDKLGLQLKELQRKRRQTSKVPSEGDVAASVGGVIKKLFPHESYGFITTADRRDIYFHENALKGLSMEQLSEGDAVQFAETDGDKGPQASWVRTA
ncbi:MAG: HPF/RaiA family ribosome-associated protein [Thermodesulfobacteriota bacterium]|nr:HPF/RaiA family ribosome-associated protein [Thermodesulfobacteriota bacterium]